MLNPQSRAGELDNFLATHALIFSQAAPAPTSRGKKHAAPALKYRLSLAKTTIVKLQEI